MPTRLYALFDFGLTMDKVDCDTLPIEWRIGLKEIVEFHRELYQIDIG